MYADSADGSSILWPGNGGHEDLGVKSDWKMLVTSYKDAFESCEGHMKTYSYSR